MSADLLKNKTEKLLTLLGTEAQVTIKEGHRTVVVVTTQDSKDLVGPHGEHLRALNLLLHKLVEKELKEGSVNFLVDVNEYYESSMEKVRQDARMHAQRARLFKHDVELEPMSAYERLVVHELFAEDPEIKTESAGEGKFRHIVLKYGVK